MKSNVDEDVPHVKFQLATIVNLGGIIDPHVPLRNSPKSIGKYK